MRSSALLLRATRVPRKAFRQRALPSQFQQYKFMSDNLLGHSPMAQSVPNQASSDSKIPTAKDITTSGGVWAPTSAKREKLTELKGELEQGQTLDDAASQKEQLDLWLVDGITAIARSTDGTIDRNDDNLTAMQEWLNSRKLDASINKTQWQSFLQSVVKKIDTLLEKVPTNSCLVNVREYIDVQDVPENLREAVALGTATALEKEFERAAVRSRLLLTKSVAEKLEDSWDTLATVSDQDVDRAAVRGESLERAVEKLGSSTLMKILQECLTGTCQTRVDALWDLIDRDNDGLLDEPEMNRVCEILVESTGKATQLLVNEAIAVRPLYNDVNTQLGWRERRREKREKKILTKMIGKTIRSHFEDEAEMPHRLRCIYAWSEKSHQDNRIESVLVEESGYSVRKRYVELQPKISLSEFREVQKEHFTHLDRISVELMKSYREDVLVHQGKGRQNKELIRDCAAFLTVVCGVDFAITSF